MTIKFLAIFATLIISSLNFQTGEKKTILFFGDSITAGYGLEKEQAFPNLIQEKIDSLQLNFEVINGGLSGETSAGGLRRIDWMLQKPIDIFILELGANDGLRGLPLDQTYNNLTSIIEKVRAKNPDVIIYLAGMQIPPNLGPEYTKNFKELFPRIVEEQKVNSIPFILDKVAAEKDLNLADGIHPNVKGHKIVAETVWSFLKQNLN